MAHQDSLGRPMPVDARGLLIPDAAAEQEAEARGLIREIVAAGLRDIQSKYQDPRQILPIPDGVPLDTAWRIALDYLAFASFPSFVPKDGAGDGVALSSISHPDGSLLAVELAAEAEEIWAEENPDLSAITRDIARGE